MRGDFGISLSTMEPVVNIIGPRIEFTLLVSLLSLMLSWGVGIAMGVYCATHQHSIGDNVASLVGLVTLSVPPFLTGLGLLVLIVLAFNAPLPIGLFSAEYTSAPWSIGKFLDLLWHLWIPVVVVGMTGAASVMRMMRANLLDEVRKQYVETARAKGLTERRVIYRHAVRIAINPLIALLGVEFPLLISNGIVISIVLGLPTIGPVLQDSLVARDVYVASAILMLLGALLVVGNLVSDLLLAWIDPRIRFS
jgi:peptide/nickel transport system permease protein